MYRQKQANAVDIILLIISTSLFLSHLPVLPAIVIPIPHATVWDYKWLLTAHIWPTIGISNIAILVYVSVKRFSDVFYHQPTNVDTGLRVGRSSRWLSRYTILVTLNFIATYTIMIDIQYMWANAIKWTTLVALWVTDFPNNMNAGVVFIFLVYGFFYTMFMVLLPTFMISALIPSVRMLSIGYTAEVKPIMWLCGYAARIRRTPEG